MPEKSGVRITSQDTYKMDNCSRLLVVKIVLVFAKTFFVVKTIGNNEGSIHAVVGSHRYVIKRNVERDPWSSGCEWRIMFVRLWVQIPVPYAGLTFFHIDL